MPLHWQHGKRGVLAAMGKRAFTIGPDPAFEGAAPTPHASPVMQQTTALEARHARELQMPPVAAETFVGAIAGERYGHVLSCGLGDEIGWKHGVVAERFTY